MTAIFNISKLLIKKRLKVLSDSEKIELKNFYKEYPFLKEIKIEGLVDKLENLSSIDNEKAWSSIDAKYQTRNNKSVFNLFPKVVYKYAAAILIIGLTFTIYFTKETGKNVEKKPLIVNKDFKSNKPSSEKVTLTLEDGSVIPLKKGKNYQTNRANSNGEQLVYGSENINSKKLTYNYLTINRGGQFHLVLADGTEVWLNSESQLKYPIAFVEGQTRTVELMYGEAYFEVSPSTAHKGARFEVYNNKQQVEVVGTKFNIKAYRDESNIYTTLVEGKVNVNIDGQKQKLVPNQQLNLDIRTNTSIIKSVDTYAEISWKDGLFSFKGKPLKEIMKVLSRWYDVDVVFENKKLESIAFKGVLGKNQDLKQIMETIKNLSIIKNYEIKDKQIILK